ncbi:MAG TPA: type VI secretion system ATPase TssH, partial [Thiotrichales bacterium]|nr:type VI secretion system ATPase TssH [Thiotrichales bacterium]
FEEMKKAVMEVVGMHFRPEFINRVDESVVFHPLGKEEIRKIVEIQLVHLHKRLAERDLQIEFTDAVLDKLADAGFDPVYGARPLKRAIQHEVENPLAQDILAGRYVPGDTIVVELQAGELAFGKKSGQQAA